MPLEPFRSDTTSTIEAHRYAEMIGDDIESAINIYSEERYGDVFFLERFSDISWNVYPNSTGTRLLQVRLADFSKQPWHPKNPKTQGYYLRVEFNDPSLDDSGSDKVERAHRFCRDLSTRTGLSIMVARSLKGDMPHLNIIV